MHIDEVACGSNWCVLGWNLSTPQCQIVTSGFQLNLTSIREGNYEMLNCTINATNLVDSKFVFNTSSRDCNNNITLSPCSSYNFIIIPYIFGTLYQEYSESIVGLTVPGKSVKISVNRKLRK